jgi:hypothetical protein
MFVHDETAKNLANTIVKCKEYGKFVPQDMRDDNSWDLTSSDSERNSMLKSMWELADIGINEYGPDIGQFFCLVHGINWRNSQIGAQTGEFMFPCVVVERSFYSAVLATRVAALDTWEQDTNYAKTKDPPETHQWIEYAVPDDKFFATAKEIANLMKLKCLVFAMLSRPGNLNLTHFHVGALCFKSDSTWESPMAVFGAEGDQQDGDHTAIQEHTLPYKNASATEMDRPTVVHASKLFDKAGAGSSDDIQNGLQKCNWSGMICASYVLILFAHLVTLGPGKHSEFAISTKVSGLFHLDFLARLTKKVKTTTARYLDALKGASIQKPVLAVIINLLEPLKTPFKVVQIIKLLHSLDVSLQDPHGKNLSSRTFHDMKNSMYILGVDAIAVHNLNFMREICGNKGSATEDKVEDMNNLVAHLEDFPGEKVVSISYDGQGKPEVVVDNDNKLATTLDLDNELFAQAAAAGVGDYTIKCYLPRGSAHANRDRYGVLLVA